MLAATGHLELTDWSRLKGGTRPSDPPLRAFELPGEPVWVAAGTRTGLRVWDYWNVPVAALLIVSIAAVGLALGGPTLALVAGFVAALDPVTLLHASNRDDAVLGAALLWAVFAIIALRWRGWGYVALFIAAGAAAITRMEAVLLIVPLLALGPIRRAAAIAVAGVVMALGVWGVRNQVVLGHFVIGSTHDGITLWEANGPFARGSLALGQVDIVSMNKTVMAPIFAETQDLDEVGADAYFKRQALRYMALHPLERHAHIGRESGGLYREHSPRSATDCPAQSRGDARQRGVAHSRRNWPRALRALADGDHGPIQRYLEAKRRARSTLADGGHGPIQRYLEAKRRARSARSLLGICWDVPRDARTAGTGTGWNALLVDAQGSALDSGGRQYFRPPDSANSFIIRSCSSVSFSGTLMVTSTMRSPLALSFAMP